MVLRIGPLGLPPTLLLILSLNDRFWRAGWVGPLCESVAVSERSSAGWQKFLSALPPELADLHRSPPADVLPLPTGRGVTIPELLTALREQTARPPVAGGRGLRQDRDGAGLVAAAWRHVTHRQAQAVLQLFDVGLAVEAQTNARACVEHAVALQRLALAADDDQLEPLLEDLVREQQRRQSRVLDYLDGLDASSGGQHSGLLAAARSEHDAHQVPANRGRPRTRTVRDVFLGVPDGEHLHSIYSRLSENSHAGLASAAPYLLRALQTEQPVPARPEPVPWAEALALLCWACWAADDAMRRFLVDGDDIAARHIPIMARLGLATA